ncbi:MAG: cyclic nucleotide-binding domain-containing protein [Spirochaetales bacterium]|nr:cyclic nucleotide-binding domain-containing protein [Spirochaetales bacterium]
MKPIDVPQAELTEKLRGLQIFANLSPEEIDHLFPLCEFHEYKDKEKIIKQNETSTFLCGILAGDVSVYATSKEGREIRLGRVHKGDVVGEASLFFDVRRTADVTADGRVEIMKIERENFMSFVNTNAKAGVKVFAFMIFSLIHKLKNINAELVFEKEASVTPEELERLKAYFAPAVDDYIP